MTQAGTLTTSGFTANAPAALTQPTQPRQPVILHDRWPSLAAAMGQYQQNLAEEFSRRVYACVHEGLISGSDRRRLAREAADLGLRSFDAQLVIACAIRQWSLDQPARRRKPISQMRFPSRRPIVHKLWFRVAIIGLMALLIDTTIIMLWLR